MQPIQLEPMAVIQAQRARINALTDENVQLSAAVAMLQEQIEMTEKANPLVAVEDVTDEVVGAEVNL